MHDTRTEQEQEQEESTSTPAREGTASPLAEKMEAAYQVFRSAHRDCEQVGYEAFVTKARAYGSPDVIESAEAFSRDVSGALCLPVPLREIGKYFAKSVRDHEDALAGANLQYVGVNSRKKGRRAAPLYTDADLAIPV